MTKELQKYLEGGNMFPSLFDQKTFESIFQALDEPARWYPAQTAYPYNVEEERDETSRTTKTVLTFALAGVEKDAIKIEVIDNSLKVRVEKSESVREGNWVTRHKGISSRSLNLSFKLNDVDESKITSKFENGLLEITLPSIEHKTHNIKID